MTWESSLQDDVVNIAIIIVANKIVFFIFPYFILSIKSSK